MILETMQLELRDRVHVLSLHNHEGENALNSDVMKEYYAVFDEIDNFKGNTALLISCDHEKTFSTGIDLAWLMAESDTEKREFVRLFETMLCRLATLSAPTVACINGNAYAGGAIIPLACDFRLMRADKGRLCLPEVNLKMVFPPVPLEIIQLIPNTHVLKQMALMGTAYTGQECMQYELVDAIHPLESLHDEAFAFAQTLAEKDRSTYVAIRNSMRPEFEQHKINLGIA